MRDKKNVRLFNRTRLIKLLENLGPFLLFGFYGVIGIFIDSDHLENWLIHATPITTGTLSPRPHHMEIFILVGFLFFYICARAYRFLFYNMKRIEEGLPIEGDV